MVKNVLHLATKRGFLFNSESVLVRSPAACRLSYMAQKFWYPWKHETSMPTSVRESGWVDEGTTTYQNL